MPFDRLLCRTTLVGVGLAALAFSAAAAERGNIGGITFASGGIGLSERVDLHAERSRYNLWVATVAKGSGAYLAGAHLRISSSDGGRSVLERSMAGPWFFAMLPPGQYRVSVSIEGADVPAQTMTTGVRIRPGDRRQVVMRFTSSAEVRAEGERPYGGNPFDGVR